MVRQAFQTLRPARFHPVQHLRRNGRQTDGAGLHGEFRLAAVLGEGDGRELFEEGIVLLVPRHRREDKPLRLHDHAEYACHRMIDAARAAHDDAQCAAWPHIHFANRVGKPFRSPPLRHLFWIDPRLEHDFARRIEDLRDNQLASFTDRGVGCRRH